MSRVLWPELEPSEVADGWLPDVPRVTSAQVLAALESRHYEPSWNGYPPRWVFAQEVQARTGQYGDAQRFDAVAIGLVPSVKYARLVYEVKVSRSDWLRELKPLRDATWRGGLRLSPGVLKHYDDVTQLEQSGYEVREYQKWEAALEVSTEYWIAAPPKCVLVEELPEEAGLIEVRPWGPSRELKARVVRKAPVRETPTPGPEFWAAVLRRVGRREPVSPSRPEPA